jgi:hypothetical protein
VGNIVFQAPPGLNAFSSLVMAGEPIRRSENGGRTITVEGTATVDTVVLFKTDVINGEEEEIKKRDETTNVNQRTRTVKSPRT